MSTPVRSILRSLQKPDNSPLNVITFTNYPYYDSMFARTNNLFHCYNGTQLPSDWREEVLPKPPNHLYSISPDIPLNIDCDLILAHNKLHQFEASKALSRFWHLPVALVHQFAPRDFKYHTEWKNIQARQGHTNIFLSAKIQEEWQSPGFIINPGVVTPDEITPAKVSGAIGHLPCTKDELKLLHNMIGNMEFIKQGDMSGIDILVNTTNAFYPIHILHAMAHGKIVVTIAMPELENIITHEETGFIIKDVTDFKKIIAHIRHNSNTLQDMRIKAHNHIKQNFPMQDFCKKMSIALEETSQITYTR
jgi:hypothetical protein